MTTAASSRRSSGTPGEGSREPFAVYREPGRCAPSMSFHQADALLLDVRDLQEQDRIVVFLTREQGKKRGVARAARRKYSRFAGQLQPLARVRLGWFEKEGRELVRLTAAELVRPAAKLQEDLDGILLGSYLADHMLEFAQENEGSDLYFRLLDSTLEALLAGVDRDLAARYFEAWVLRLAGVFPAPFECPLCGRPLTAAGQRAVLPPAGEGLICRECFAAGASSAGLVVEGDTLELLRRIGRESLRRVAERPPGKVVLRQAEEVAAQVRRAFLQHELRSYQVIQRTKMEV